MTYHWEWISADQVALFENGYTWTGSMPAFGVAVAINKSGPGLGTNAALYAASGSLMPEEQHFASFEEAMKAVEAIATAKGDQIESR